MRSAWSAVVQLILQGLSSQLVLGYLDDLTLNGKASEVAAEGV